jgi:translation elongation factor EF-1alpha
VQAEAQCRSTDESEQVIAERAPKFLSQFGGVEKPVVLHVRGVEELIGINVALLDILCKHQHRFAMVDSRVELVLHRFGQPPRNDQYEQIAALHGVDLEREQRLR